MRIGLPGFLLMMQARPHSSIADVMMLPWCWQQIGYGAGSRPVWFEKGRPESQGTERCAMQAQCPSSAQDVHELLNLLFI